MSKYVIAFDFFVDIQAYHEVPVNQLEVHLVLLYAHVVQVSYGSIVVFLVKLASNRQLHHLVNLVQLDSFTLKEKQDTKRTNNNVSEPI